MIFKNTFFRVQSVTLAVFGLILSNCAVAAVRCTVTEVAPPYPQQVVELAKIWQGHSEFDYSYGATMTEESDNRAAIEEIDENGDYPFQPLDNGLTLHIEDEDPDNGRFTVLLLSPPEQVEGAAQTQRSTVRYFKTSNRFNEVVFQAAGASFFCKRLQ